MSSTSDKPLARKRRVKKQLPKKEKCISANYGGQRLTGADVVHAGALDSLIDQPAVENTGAPVIETKHPEPPVRSFEELQAELARIQRDTDAIAVRARAGLDKDQLALAKFERELLDSQGVQIRHELKMFHKATLSGAGAVRAVRIIREDFTGVSGPPGTRVEGALT